MKPLTILFSLIFLVNINLLAQCDDCYGTPFIGIYSNGISDKKAEKLEFDNSEGSYVTGIISNTAAEKAGLKAFDYIFGIGEYRTEHGRSLTSILKKYDIGDQVIVHFYRNGKKQQTKLKLGNRSDAEYNKRNKREDPFLGVEQRSKSWEEDYFGVKVNVVKNSTAAAIGLENGDIISQINGFLIYDWTDLGTAIDMSQVGNKMEVTYFRDGQTRKSNGIIKSYADSKYGQNESYSQSYNKKDKADYSDNSYSYRNRTEPESRDIEGVTISIKDISGEAVNILSERYDINLSNNNNLSVNGLKIETNIDKGEFELNFTLPSKGNTIIDIYNAVGRNIYNYDLGNFSGDFEDKVDIAQNGIGSYFLNISQSDKNLVKEILLSKN